MQNPATSGSIVANAESNTDVFQKPQVRIVAANRILAPGAAGVEKYGAAYVEKAERIPPGENSVAS